jgi:hypothetical protein
MTTSALFDLHEQNLDGAVSNIEAIISLARFSKDEREIFLQTTRCAILGFAFQATWETLQVDGLTDAQLIHLAAAWQNCSVLPDVIPAIEVDRAMRVQVYEKIRGSYTEWQKFRRGLLSEAQCGCGNRDPLWDTEVSFLVTIWRLAWLDQDEEHLLRDSQPQIEVARTIDADRVWLKYLPPPEDERDFIHMAGLSRFFLSRFIGQNIERTMFTVVCCETQCEMAKATIALRHNQFRYRQLPQQLEELIPEFLAAAPRDWMNGQTLRYRRDSDRRFVLYSVGENGVDDGGDPKPGNAQGFGIWRGCDAVWPQAAEN